MSLAARKNIGAFVKSVIGYTGPTNVTAGAGNNASAITGSVIDLLAAATGGRPLSVSVAFPLKATLSNANTLSLAAYLQTTADGTNGPWVNVATMPAAVAVTGITSNAAQYTSVDFDVDLSAAKQYISVVYTATMSNASLDTANIYPPVLILAGQSELPV